MDVDGTWVGSVVTGGRMYKCFDPNAVAVPATERAALATAKASDTRPGQAGVGARAWNVTDNPYVAPGASPNEALLKAAREADAAQLAAIEAEDARKAAHAASPEGRAEAAAAAIAAAAIEADWRKANDLIRGYKFCMVAADSSLEARKLNAYERTLYLEYLQRADVRCRQKNRCDWAEKITRTEDPQSATGCYYDSPGL